MDWRSHIARYGSERFPGEPWVRWTLALLLLLAAVLRSWDFTDVPYTHDEISALVRIYPTLAETVQRGVIELDTHPPGVQVFEWFWTKAFGMDEAVVKLPFMLMGLVALFLLYRFAITWTSSSVALVLVTLLATMQYTIMYAQIARPYAVGFFTCALLADQLTRFIAMGRMRALVGVGLAALLSAYTHHFSFMLAGSMILSGPFLLPAGARKRYLVMAGTVVLLYLPNIPIFLHQLGQGGLGGWLAPPDASWLLSYAWWLAHCSWFFAVPLIIVVISALVIGIRSRSSAGPIGTVLLVWGGAPLLIGLAYSIWRAPVIQYSVVLFSFPFLLLWLIKGLGELDRRLTVGICATLGLTAMFTLVFSRHHYELFYASKYEAIVQGGMDLVAKTPNERALVLVDAPNEVIQFYLGHWKVDPAQFPYVQLRDQASDLLDHTLRSNSASAVFYGQSNGSVPEHLPRIQSYYPTMVERNDLLEGQTFIFQPRSSEKGVLDRVVIAEATPEQRSEAEWDIHDDLPIVRDQDDTPLWSFDQREFGCAITLPLDPLVEHEEDQIEVSVELAGSVAALDAAVVLELRQADSTVFYRTGELSAVDKDNATATLIVAARPANAGNTKPVILKAYVHNRSKGPLLVKRFTIERRAANPVQYGLIGPVESLGPYVK